MSKAPPSAASPPEEVERRRILACADDPESVIAAQGGELRASKQRLELVVESAGLAWWDQDFRTGEVTRSSNWAEMLGFSPAEIDSDLRAWKSLLHPDDLPRVEATARRHEAGETEAFEVEHRMRTQDGRWKWILNWGKVVERDEEDHPLRALGTHLDITRRKQAELDREKLIGELELALAEIKTLRGIIPICASCKKIRDDKGYWKQLETYLRDHSEARFSHGFCPECADRLLPGFAERAK